MCRRCVQMMLVVLGAAMVFFAAFPVMAFLHVEEPWQTGLVASKLILLPVGAICLLGAAAMSAKVARR
jgi:hypothetical protein